MQTLRLHILSTLLILSLLGLGNISFGQSELSQSLGFGVNQLLREGLEIEGFSAATHGGRAVLESTPLIDSGERYIRTAWVSLTPGQLTFEFQSRITNNSVGGFNPVITLLDAFGNRTQLVVEYIGNASNGTGKAELNITQRGFYRIELNHEPVSRGNRQAAWQVSNLKLSGPIQGSWQKENWLGKAKQDLSVGVDGFSNGSVFFLGDEVEITYNAGFETSGDNVVISEGNFEVIYPEKVGIKKIELLINGEIALFTTDLKSGWKNSEKGCGCPQTIKMGNNRLKNEMTVFDVEHKDLIQVRVTSIASELGDFEVSIRFKGGKARQKSDNQRNFITNSVDTNTLISFSTQEDNQQEIQGNNLPTLGNGSIIPFGTQPVELVFFRANTSQESPILEWATAVEINNDFFAIERSANGRDFYEVGRVDGKGDFVGTVEYTFTDRSARQGTWFYRLVQTDFDGTSKTYEAIRAVVQRELKPELKVLKNPSDRNQLVFMLNGVESQEFQATIVDMNGKVISSLALSSLPTDGQMITMDGLSLNKGLYILNVHNNRERLVQRILVD